MLILGERENMPSWYPAELCEISDALQPIEWYCAEHRNVTDTIIDYIWGYKELALDDTHVLGLIERENKDMELFLKRKAEIDEFEEL
ncbi:GNAT family acetyltransferase [Bacillus sp. 16GRE42]|nr:GNAT family acetyltransferase [Bacillus sp. 16GRE42]